MKCSRIYEVLLDMKSDLLEMAQLNWMDCVEFGVTVLSGIMDFVLFLIAIYTFYLTFISNKVSIITMGQSFSTWESDKITFVIKNHSLKNQLIKEVYAVFDNKYRLEIRKYDLPFVLEPLRTTKIEMEPFTYLENFTLSELCNKYTSPVKIHLEIITDDQNKMLVKFKDYKKYKINKKSNLEDIFIGKKIIDDVVVREDYKYVIYYQFGKDGKVHTAFINDGGFISTNVFGFNHIPVKYLSDEELVKNCFKDSCETNNLGMIIYKI